METTVGWYNVVWPWIGLGAAIVLLILLFSTNVLRKNLTISRWKDPSWLAWLLTTAYLLHNVEEYGIDMYGHLYAFPETMARMLNTSSTAGGLPPAAFFTAVNISMFWFASPIAAKLGRGNHRFFAVAMSGVIFINALSHIVPWVIGMGYTSGALTAVIIFLPVSLWVFHACFGKGKLKYSTLGLVILLGAFSHLFLFLGIKLYTDNVVGTTIVVLMQVINAVLALILWWGAEKIAHGKFVELK